MTKNGTAAPNRAEEDFARLVADLVRAAVLKERSEIAALVRSAYERCNRDNQEFRNVLLAIDLRR